MEEREMTLPDTQKPIETTDVMEIRTEGAGLAEMAESLIVT